MQPAKPPPEHRADIEGLRGVAILSVMAVHAWPDMLRGGFVGVDIFFVLSGFLITGILLRQQQAGRLDLVAFYARRARRLFPALATVLLACLAAGALLTFPSEARQIGRHVAAGSVFGSNFVLWMEAGYFDASSESKPLLHLWSLGIEEQFYLLWPLALLLLLRWPQHLLKATLLLMVLSFLLNVGWVEGKTKGTFFLLPTRAWELLLGAALAVLGTGRALPSPRWRNALAGLGVALIVAAFLLLDKTRPFPGWWALLPTLGTLALLAAGEQAWVNRRLLGQPLLRFYGAISYPLYLWHWPLLVFPLLLGWPMDNATRVAVLVASVALAALTLEYIERPLRFGGGPGPRRPLQLAAAMLCVGAGGLALQASDGALAGWPAEVQQVARAELGVDFGTYRADRCFLDLEQGAERFAAECWPGVPPALLLWGDSHAASLYPGLAAAAPGLALAQWTKARCPPLLVPPALASRGCAQVARDALRRIAAAPPPLVLLAGHWAFYASEGAPLPLAELRAMVAELQRLGVQRVVVMGHLPTWTRPLPRVLLAQWRSSGHVPERSLAELDPQALAADRALAAALQGSGAEFVSPIEQLCNPQGCLVSQWRNGAAEPLAFDHSHLTVGGSVRLVQGSRGRLF